MIPVISVFMILFMISVCKKTSFASDFDANFYAEQYPDVVAVYGTDPNALYSHYITYGIKERRFKNAEDAGRAVLGSTKPEPLGDTYVDVDIENQQMTYYVLGEAVLTSDIVSGNVKNGCDTPTGTFFIDSKIPGKYLVGPTWNVWVDRWMRFTGNVGLHDASWRSEFGGEIYKKNGSHGCVNLPSDVAKTLYDLVEVGTMVKVH